MPTCRAIRTAGSPRRQNRRSPLCVEMRRPFRDRNLSSEHGRRAGWIARIDEMKGADRSSIDSFVVFGPGNTAEYYGHRRRHFKCKAADIATHADGYKMSAECSETYSLVGRPQSGTLRLRTDGDWLKGRSPDGHQMVLSYECPTTASVSQQRTKAPENTPAPPNDIGITSETLESFDRLMVEIGRQMQRSGAGPRARS